MFRFNCPELYKLTARELNYEPEYTIEEEAIDEMIEHNIDVEKWITEESKREMARLEKLKEDHLAICNHECCVQIRKNREELVENRSTGNKVFGNEYPDGYRLGEL